MGCLRDAIFFAQGKAQQCYKTDTAGKGFADTFHHLKLKKKERLLNGFVVKMPHIFRERY